MSLGVFVGIDWRINDFNVSALTPGVGQAHRRAGNADQVAKGADGNALFKGQPQGLVDITDGRNADRAARSGNDVDLFRQDLADAEAKDFVGMRPADFHNADFRPVVILNDIQGRPLLPSAINPSPPECRRFHRHRWP